MNAKERKARMEFTIVVKNFLGNNKTENFDELVETMFYNFRDHGCKTNIKVHYLYCHLDSFPENLGDGSEEKVNGFPGT